jgi:hypothetical protein
LLISKRGTCGDIQKNSHKKMKHLSQVNTSATDIQKMITKKFVPSKHIQKISRKKKLKHLSQADTALPNSNVFQPGLVNLSSLNKQNIFQKFHELNKLVTPGS